MESCEDDEPDHADAVTLLLMVVNFFLRRPATERPFGPSVVSGVLG